MSDIFIFGNERYAVYLGEFESPVRSNGSEFTRGYKVVNKEYEVVEFQIPQMPEALAAAEQLDMAMEQKPWEWARKKEERIAVNPDGSSPSEVH